MDSQVNPKNVLDIGCGQGVCSQVIEASNPHYVGVDPSAFLIKRAQKLYREFADYFILGNAYSLPFDDGSFDAAFSVALWHLLENKSKASRELSRVLKDDGSFFIATANPDYYESWIKTYESSSLDGIKLKGQSTQADGSVLTDILYLHSLKDITTSLKEERLHIVNSTTFRTTLVLKGKKI